MKLHHYCTSVVLQVDILESELKLSDGKILSWMPYKGGRESSNVEAGGKVYKNVTHLKIYQDDVVEGKLLLPVSTKCLYYDLIRAIDIYTELLKSDEKLRKNWVSAANEIIKPSKF